MLAKLTAILVSYGPFGVLLLAFIDSVGIPVATGMDALIVLVATQAPSRAYLAASLGVLGSVAGNLVLFIGIRKGFSRFVKEVPRPGDKQRFRQWFYRYGLLTVFIPALLPFPPLPLKVSVASAAVLRTPVRSFVLMIVLARVIRYFGEAYLGAKLGAGSAEFLRAHTWALIGGAAGLFVGLYALLKLNERRRTRAAHGG